MANDRVSSALEEVLSAGGLTEYFNYGGPSTTVVPVNEVREAVRARVGQMAEFDSALEKAVWVCPMFCVWCGVIVTAV